MGVDEDGIDNDEDLRQEVEQALSEWQRSATSTEPLEAGSWVRWRALVPSPEPEEQLPLLVHGDDDTEK